MPSPHSVTCVTLKVIVFQTVAKALQAGVHWKSELFTGPYLLQSVEAFNQAISSLTDKAVREQFSPLGAHAVVNMIEDKRDQPVPPFIEQELWPGLLLSSKAKYKGLTRKASQTSWTNYYAQIIHRLKLCPTSGQVPMGYGARHQGDLVFCIATS
jgi:hypothetical protein